VVSAEARAQFAYRGAAKVPAQVTICRVSGAVFGSHLLRYGASASAVPSPARLVATESSPCSLAQLYTIWLVRLFLPGDAPREAVQGK